MGYLRQVLKKASPYRACLSLFSRFWNKRAALVGIVGVVVMSTFISTGATGLLLNKSYALDGTSAAGQANANTGTTTGMLPPTQEAQALVYYDAMLKCMTNDFFGKDIHYSVSSSDGSPSYKQLFPSGTALSWPPGGDEVGCDTVAQAALAFWGFNDTGAFLKALADEGECKNYASDAYWHCEGISTGKTAFSNALPLQYSQGGTVPTSFSSSNAYQGAAEFQLEYAAFTNADGACSATAVDTSTIGSTDQVRVSEGYTDKDAKTISATETANVTYTAIGVPSSTAPPNLSLKGYKYTSATNTTSNGGSTFDGGGASVPVTTNTSVPLYNASVSSPKKIDCKTIAKDLAVGGPLYNAYNTWAAQNQTVADVASNAAASDANDAAAPTCGDSVPSIGWLVCPVLNFLGGLDDAMWSITSGLLTVSPLQQNQPGSSDLTPTYTTWRTFLAFGNIVLVLAFLVIIYSQLTGAGLSNYGVKKMLPKLIIVAVSINLSFYILEIAVDLSNIVGNSVYDLVKNLVTFKEPSWSAGSGALMTIVAASGLAVAGVAIAPGAAFAMILPGVIAAALGFLAALAVLVLRQAMIPILAVVAPVAYALYLFPNTKPWFDKWRKALTTMLMLFPLAGLMFAGVQLAAAIILGEGTGWQTFLALLIMGVPLFMLPFIARQANGILGTVGNKMQGWANKSRGLTAKGVAPMKERSLKNMMNADTLKGRGRFNVGRRAVQGLARHRGDVEAGTSAIASANAEQETKRRTDSILAGNIKTGNEEADKILRRQAIAAQEKERDSSVSDAKTELERESRDFKGGTFTNTLRDEKGKAILNADGTEKKVTRTYEGGQQAYYQKALNDAIDSGDAIRARAAYSQLASTGLTGVAKGTEALEQGIASGQLAKGQTLRQELASHISKAHPDIKGQSIFTSQFATEDMDIPPLSQIDAAHPENVARMQGAIASMTDAQMAGQHADFIAKAREMGLLTADQANRILETPQISAGLKVGQRAQFAAVSGVKPELAAAAQAAVDAEAARTAGAAGGAATVDVDVNAPVTPTEPGVLNVHQRAEARQAEAAAGTAGTTPIVVDSAGTAAPNTAAGRARTINLTGPQGTSGTETFAVSGGGDITPPAQQIQVGNIGALNIQELAGTVTASGVAPEVAAAAFNELGSRNALGGWSDGDIVHLAQQNNALGQAAREEARRRNIGLLNTFPPRDPRSFPGGPGSA